MTVMRTRTAYHCDDRATIFLEGEIDLDTAPAVGVAVQNCVSRGAVRIDLDLSRLVFCDVMGLNAFLTAALYVDAMGGRLLLRRPTPAVHRVFHLTDTTALLGRSGVTPLSSLPPEVDGPVPPGPGRPAASGDQ